MPQPDHSVFYRPDALPAAQPTVKALKAFMSKIASSSNVEAVTQGNWTCYDARASSQ